VWFEILGGYMENEEEKEWWKKRNEGHDGEEEEWWKRKTKTLIFTNLSLLILLTMFAM